MTGLLTFLKVKSCHSDYIYIVRQCEGFVSMIKYDTLLSRLIDYPNKVKSYCSVMCTIIVSINTILRIIPLGHTINILVFCIKEPFIVDT